MTDSTRESSRVTTAEVHRAFESFRRDYERDRKELREAMAEGFRDLKDTIATQQAVSVPLYNEGQHRQDERTDRLEDRVEDLEDAATHNRRLALGAVWSMGGSVVAGVVLFLITQGA